MLFYGSPFILQFFYVSSAVVYRQVFLNVFLWNSPFFIILLVTTYIRSENDHNEC